MKKIWLMFFFLILTSPALGGNLGLMLKPAAMPKIFSLVDTLKLGLLHNEAVKISEAYVELSEGESTVATSKLLPRVDGKLSHESPPRARLENGDGQITAGLEVNIPLLDTHALLRAKAARVKLEGTKEQRRATQEQVFYEIGELYVDALIAQALSDNAREEQEQFLKQVAILERKTRVGNARMLDLRRAQYLSAKAYSEYLLKQQDFNKKMGALGKKIGVQDSFLLSNISIESPHLKKDALEMLSMASVAADVSVLHKELSSASFLVHSEGFSFLPKLEVSFLGGFSFSTMHHRIVPAGQEIAARTLLSLTLPIFSGGSTLAALKMARARRSIAEVHLRSKQMEKQLSINSLLSELRDLEIVTKNAEVALDAALLAKDSAERMFDNNEATGLELTEAQTYHFSAKNLLANGRLSLERAKLKLLFALGKIGEIVGQ